MTVEAPSTVGFVTHQSDLTPFQQRVQKHIIEINEKIEQGILPAYALYQPIIVDGVEDYTYCLSTLTQTDQRLDGRLEFSSSAL
jgi:hypothetical protein